MRTDAQREHHRLYCRDWYRRNHSRNKDYHREYARKWRAANPDKSRECYKKSSIRYKARYPEKVKSIRKAYYWKNRQKAIQQAAVWQSNNRDKVSASNKKHSKERTAKKKAYWNARMMIPEHREKYRIYRRKWYAKNPHFGRNHQHKRRSIKRLGNPKECAVKISKLMTEKNCYWCGLILARENLHIDHVIPLSRGGPHAADNLVACCARCNHEKGSKLYWEWDGELAA